jgi:glyoxylase-like metal-dependent hydrolase (beta-lactamase superfamily II)
MRKPTRPREVGRGERVLPGAWRLRLPLKWNRVPHVNAWALQAGEQIVLVDTGLHDRGTMVDFERALAITGHRVEDIGLIVITHAHSDHSGQAPELARRAHCEVWIHPAYTLHAEDPALRSDRDLVNGVEIETDLGAWTVIETPGHAPSHVCLHQRERRLLISGDHLLGRTVLFFDHGHSPDPVGEFLGGLEEVEPLEIDLVLPGHGRPFRDPEVKIAEARRQVEELIGKVKASLAEGEKTAFEIVGEIVGAENVNTPVSAWVLQIVLSCLDHLTILGEVEPVDGADPQRWVLL